MVFLLSIETGLRVMFLIGLLGFFHWVLFIKTLRPLVVLNSIISRYVCRCLPSGTFIRLVHDPQFRLLGLEFLDFLFGCFIVRKKILSYSYIIFNVLFFCRRSVITLAMETQHNA